MVPERSQGEEWSVWSKFVLKELERLNDCQNIMNEQLTRIREDIAGLKVQSGLWGACGGAIPVIIMIAVSYFSKK